MKMGNLIIREDIVENFQSKEKRKKNWKEENRFVPLPTGLPSHPIPP
jgi:hypothetical protein